MTYLTPHIQSYCLYAALIVYGGFSSPTPDGLGLAEITVALLLFLSFRIVRFENILIPWAALGYGLAIPSLMAFINGNDMSDIIRDIIPFFYLLIPIFLGWVGLYERERVLSLIAAVGILFSLRTIYSYQSVLFDAALWGQGPPADLLYLANSPEVLFSALYCIGCGGQKIMEKNQRVLGMIILSLSILPILAMTFMMQRAGIGVVCLYVVIAMGVVFYRSPKWGGIFLALILAVMCFAWPLFGHVFQMIWQKTELVGLNTRAEEWSVVIERLSDGWGNILFGEGWGGKIENPAVGGLSVNYTHSLISSLLLKAGLIGTIVILAGCLMPVIRAFGAMIARKCQIDLVLLGAVLFPFLISVFLYASYKSLGFGLILLVFFIFPIRKLEKIK